MDEGRRTESGAEGRAASLRRELGLRVLLAALLLSLLVAGLGYLAGRRELAAAIEERVTTAAGLLEGGVSERLADGETSLRDAVEAELSELASRLPPARTGRFLRLRVVAAEGEEILRWSDPERPLEGAAELSDEDLPAPDRGVSLGPPRAVSAVRLVPIGVAIEREDGTVAGRVQGWYALAPEALAAVRVRAIRAAAAGVAVVLVTALVLYPLFRRLLDRLAGLSTALLAATLETLSALGSAIALRDSDTDAHNYRVTLYAVRLAEAMKLPEPEIRRLIKGAFVHDVGKIGIRDDVLLKPGRLDETEFAQMKRHVDLGLDLVARTRWLADAAEVVGGHHEKIDGSGYPHGLDGSRIPRLARIFAVADVFDAVTSERPYHRPRTLESALELLESGRGSHFDPDVLDRFAILAPALHAEFANRSEEPKRAVAELVERYYRGDLAALVLEIEA